MDQFKKTIRTRITWSIVGAATLVGLTAFAYAYGMSKMGDDHGGDFIRGFQMGLFCGLLFVMLFNIGVNWRAYRNEAYQKKLFITENDERNRAICDKIGGVGFNVIIFLLTTGGIVAGFFDTTVFFTLISAALAASLVKLGLKVYFYRKT